MMLADIFRSEHILID
jgi:hypothetical protein